MKCKCNLEPGNMTRKLQCVRVTAKRISTKCQRLVCRFLWILVALKRNRRPLAPFNRTSVSMRTNCNGRSMKEKTRRHYKQWLPLNFTQKKVCKPLPTKYRVIQGGFKFIIALARYGTCFCTQTATAQLCPSLRNCVD